MFYICQVEENGVCEYEGVGVLRKVKVASGKEHFSLL